ncbi:MAG: FAD-binding protein [Deltaproteobacteria bacterium]|nr:MAG: FAD-binding protein [Deltaproteobacteria bacterium]
MDTRWDVIVIGAGAAGLTAGIYLGRARKKTLILDHGTVGGQMILTYAVANYPGVPESAGASIVQTMREQAEGVGCTVLGHADVVRFDLSGPEKVVEVDDEGTFTAPVVILATGGVPRRLGLPSEEAFQARGISYCATCDGDFFTDQDIVVIGGGNSALEEAVSLTKYASSVTVIHEFEEFQAQPWAVEEARKNPKVRFLTSQEVVEFAGEGTLSAVVTRDKRTGELLRTEASGAFLFIGYVPNTGWLEGVVALNERGEIVTDEDLRTNVLGVFAAGDARVKRYRQITTAVADGTVAALSAIHYLDELARAAA